MFLEGYSIYVGTVSTVVAVTKLLLCCRGTQPIIIEVEALVSISLCFFLNDRAGLRKIASKKQNVILVLAKINENAFRAWRHPHGFGHIAPVAFFSAYTAQDLLSLGRCIEFAAVRRAKEKNWSTPLLLQ